VRVVADVVQVIGDGLDVVEHVFVEVLAALALVTAALDHVVEVRNHAGGDESLTVLVEIDAPRIRRAPGEDLELTPRRMEAPHAAIDRSALAVRAAGLADVRVREHAVAAVEPTVGTPRERVERLVRVLIGPAVEQDLGLRIGHQIAVLVGHEHEIRRGADPHAAEADLQTADQVEAAHEHGALLEFAVVVGVLEHDDVVVALALGRAHRIGVRLGDPQATLVVDRERDRLVHVGLARDQVDVEARRHGHRGRGFDR